MEEMANNYLGPHQIKVVRNTTNLGIAQHVHKIDLEARGALILHAAGDDISLPERTLRITQTWLSFEKPPSVTVSNAYVIGPARKQNGALVNFAHPSCFMDGKTNNFHSVLGCSLAVSKDLIKTFDTIDERIIAEDVVLYRRAELLNGIFYLNEPLVKWRSHLNSITHSGCGNRKNYLTWQKKWIRDTRLRIAQADADRAKLNLPGSSYTDNYRTLINVKISALESNLIFACTKLIITFLQKKISAREAKDVAKIILVRARLLTP